jgi:hypothetical protein
MPMGKARSSSPRRRSDCSSPRQSDQARRNPCRKSGAAFFFKRWRGWDRKAAGWTRAAGRCGMSIHKWNWERKDPTHAHRERRRLWSDLIRPSQPALGRRCATRGGHDYLSPDFAGGIRNNPHTLTGSAGFQPALGWVLELCCVVYLIDQILRACRLRQSLSLNANKVSDIHVDCAVQPELREAQFARPHQRPDPVCVCSQIPGRM